MYVDPIMNFSQQINMDATRDQDMSNTIANATQELYVGQQFNDMKSMWCAVKIYSMKAHHTFTVAYLSAKYEEYRCPMHGISCHWKVRVCYCSREHLWEITKYNEPHICLLASLS